MIIISQYHELKKFLEKTEKGLELVCRWGAITKKKDLFDPNQFRI